MDLQRVALANVVGFSLSLPLRVLLAHWGLAVLGYYDLLGLFLLATLLMWTIRVVVKFLYDMEFNSKRAKRVFIFGTKNGGISLAKSIRNEENRRYILAGFVSADEKYINKLLMGVRVVKNDLALVEEMKLRGATVLLVSPLYSDKFRAHTELVDRLIEANIHIHMMPPTVVWDGKSPLQYEALKEVDIEDLLPREQIEVNVENMSRMLTGKRILITGAAGSIGSEMVRQIAAFQPKELVLIDQAETPMHDVRIFLSKQFPNLKAHTIVTSICNASRIEEVFKEFRPEYVFHAAAYKHVPRWRTIRVRRCRTTFMVPA